MKKLIAVLLTLTMVLCLFTGCDRLLEMLEQLESTPTETLPYEFNQQMVDDFYTLLRETEAFCLETRDLTAAEEKIEALDNSYLELIDQYQIAFINYCLAQSDEELKQRYLDCVDISTEAETAYNDMCRQVYLTNTELRDELFADWTAEEIDLMLKRNEEIAQLEKRNAEITVEYRDLEEDDDWEENMVVLYNELVQNNNRIARIYGYENYYEYACKMVYGRDYEMEEILGMRQHVARYLPEAYQAALEQFAVFYDELNYQEQGFMSDILYEPYDALTENYVELYMESAPAAAQAGMTDMFRDQRVIFTDSDDAYEGAFTTWIDGKPYCYFGPGYCDSVTVIHELGHYYGCSFTDLWDQPMDLSETQSQGNEWLFTRFLKEQVPADVYDVLVEYKLVSDMGNIICFSMIDEFEQQVYASDRAGDMTVAQYDAIMESVAESYGGIDYITENIMDVQLYWKYVVLESPVYYISYAVSGVSAINLFTVAEADMDKAFEIYIRLIEEPQEDGGFLDNIRYAGLTDPFEETVYRQLHERYVN